MKFRGDYTGHEFGQETTVREIVRRIAWEYEAAGVARLEGNVVTAMAHDLTRVAYTERLALMADAEALADTVDRLQTQWRER